MFDRPACPSFPLHSSAPLSRQQPDGVMHVFDRQTKLQQKERAARAADAQDFDYLKEEIGYRVADRVLDIKRQMDLGVDLGSGRGFVTRHVTGHSLKKVVAVEMSPTMVEQCQGPSEEEVSGGARDNPQDLF